MVLNPNRPSNPFTPTEEPDWVAVPRSASRLSSFSSMSSSPYEHINHSSLLSTSVASNSSPRKLPPPLDPATLPAKVGQIKLHDEQTHTHTQRNEAPPPPPPRRQTSTSLLQFSQGPVSSSPQPALRESKPTIPQQQLRTVSSSSQMSTKSKAPPPIARKPAHLTSTSPTASPSLPESSRSGSLIDHQMPRRPIPRKASTTVSNLTSKLEASGAGTLTGGMTKTPSPRARSNTIESNGYTIISSSRVSLPGLGNVERKPALPARPQQQQQDTQPSKPETKPAKSNVDLLSNDDGAEMSGWETLKPT